MSDIEELYDELSLNMQNEIAQEIEMIQELKADGFNNIDERLDTIDKILYVKNNTNILDKATLRDIKQIEKETTYTLLKNGYLYKNDKLLDDNVQCLWLLGCNHIYKIKSDNVILPVNNVMKDDIDYYLNNNNCKYKKVIKDVLHIVALTQEGDVRATICDAYSVGIIPENFTKVDDIIFVKESNHNVPYIVKNNRNIPLYVHY